MFILGIRASRHHDRRIHLFGQLTGFHDVSTYNRQCCDSVLEVVKRVMPSDDVIQELMDDTAGCFIPLPTAMMATKEVTSMQGLVLPPEIF
eukprot:COSAG01_NODE_65379_length_273_cov_0.925287_1_plen_90_part_11